MKSGHRRSFKRPVGVRRYRKLLVIAVEGTKTEPQYFAIFNTSQSTIWVKCIKGNHASSPPQVLKRMENYLKEKSLNKTDEAWLVVDKDQWTDAQLTQLYNWSQVGGNYGFALSNPKFEYWLLLHFENGTGISSTQECNERLKRYLPDYDKHLDTRKITTQRVIDAINRAKVRDNPPCTDWPRRLGSTTVYKLVKKIVQFNM